MDKATAIQEAEKLITSSLDAFKQGAHNISATEVDRKKYQETLQKISWEDFVRSADYSYFTSRILFTQYIYLYGFFCAHQCVENYLKGLLSLLGQSVPQIHSLRQLLATCRNFSTDSNSFIFTEYAEAICLKYEPFYEITRYPACIAGPKDGQYVWASGVDQKILDYFVYRMRGLMPLPEGGWDILSEQGHSDLLLVKERQCEVMLLFRQNNLNFL